MMTVVKVNRSSKCYDAKWQRSHYICIFATGSKAFVPIEGSDLPSVIGWRTIEDTERIIDIANKKKKAIVVVGITWFRMC